MRIILFVPTRYSSAELIAMAKAFGWVLARVRGSHHIFVHPSIPGNVSIPHPRKDIPAGTAHSIIKKIQGK